MSILDKVKILVVDDHPLFSEGLCHLLEQLADKVDIITVTNAKEAFDIVNSHKDIDLVLLDLALPDMQGLDVLKQLSIHAPLLPVVIVSASDKYSDMKRALNSGAMGYISKTERSHVMLSALRTVMDGEIYVPEKLLNPLSFTNKNAEMIAEPPTLALNQLGASLHGETVDRVKVQYYEADSSVFIDAEYLIKGVAGAILWRLLQINKAQGRTEFSNRELRLDAKLRLPEIADNLEARLILLLRRLNDKCSYIKMEKTGRGRFRLLISRTLDILPTTTAS